MRVLIANLKHLYQRRHLWFAYAFVAFMLMAGSMDDDSRPTFPSSWYLPLFGGMLMAGTNLDVMGKPFVFCLPGHLRVIRVAVFLVGLAVSMPAGALFMRHHPVGVWGLPVLFCAAVCTSMAIYLGMAGRSRLIAFFSLLPFFLLVPRLQIAFEAAIVRHPLYVIAGGGSVCLFVWLHMGQWKWVRVHTGHNLYLGASDRQQRLYGQLERRYTREAGAAAAMASFFISRMEHAPDYSTSRYIWGSLYAKWGNLAIWWKSLVLAFVGVSVIALYTGWLGAITAFFGVSWIIVSQSWPPLHSAQLLPAGRRDRFLATVFLAAGMAGSLGLWIAVLSVLSVPLSVLIPEIEVWDLPVACKPIPMSIVSVPLIAVPLAATFFVLLPGRLHTAMVIALFAMSPIFGMPMVALIAIWMEMHNVGLAGGATLWIVAAVALAWVLFVLACGWRTRFLSLAGR